MRRPSPFSASTLDLRRIRDAFRAVYQWIDAGTRTLELPRDTVAAEDLIELVKPDGTRYAAPSSDIGGGGGGGAVDSVFGRTGHVVAMPGDYTASDVGLGNVTDDAQLKRAAGDFATFPTKTNTVAADIVLIEDSAASGAKKAVSLGNIIPKVIDPATLSPVARYRASNVTLVSGAVDTIIDTGSMAKDFVAIASTHRASLGTDGLGNSYIDFTTASQKLYQAGVAADWKFLNDNRFNYSVVMIVKPTFPHASGTSANCALLGTVAWSSSSRGFVWGTGHMAGYVQNSCPWEVGILDGSASDWRVRMRFEQSYQTTAPTTPQIMCFNFNRFRGNTSGLAGGGCLGFSSSTNYERACGAEMWIDKALSNIDSSPSGTTSNADTAPAQPLSLGGFRGAGTTVSIPCAGIRFYELIIYKHNLTAVQIAGLAEYAALTYGCNLDEH